jgi:dihydropyrimidine dehydrogenase (NADP+)
MKEKEVWRVTPVDDELVTPGRAPPAEAPPLAALVGAGVRRCVDHYDMLREEQAVAIINEDLCINCGRCYMACNDNAYQVGFGARAHCVCVCVRLCGAGRGGARARWLTAVARAQAITFDPKTHLAHVIEDKCTGCGICESVCPAPNCIQVRDHAAYMRERACV